VRVEFTYSPFPVHVPFHLTRAREKAIIGAVGSGKTIALCADGIAHMLEQPGSRGGLFRQSVPSLRDTTETEFINLLATPPPDEEAWEAGKITTLWEVINQNDGVRREAGHIRSIVFPNGSEMHFQSLDKWSKHMGRNMSWIGIDEASEITVDSYLALLTRLRQQEPLPAARRIKGLDLSMWKRPRQHLAIAANPDGHNWIWEYHVNYKPTVKQVRNGTWRKWFKSTSFDNPTFYTPEGDPNTYLLSLLTMPELWVRRYVLCQFDTFEGQILPFRRDEHVHAHFDPPEDWERAMGLDWGLRNPCAVSWWARKPGTTRWYKYREWMSHNPMIESERQLARVATVHEVAAHIKRLEHFRDSSGNLRREQIKYRVADPAIKQRTADAGKSVFYWFGTHGLHFQLGMKDYGSRINSLIQLLVSGDLTISDHCEWTIAQYEQYRWSKLSVARETDGPERPHKKDDHLVDADQYLATIFVSNRQVPAELKPMTFDEEVWSVIKKQVMRDRARWKRGGWR
jgi:hypothetical protein